MVNVAPDCDWNQVLRPDASVVGSKAIQPAPGTNISTQAWVDPEPADPSEVTGHFVFMAIPRTSTGKVQKFVLRDQAKEIARNANAGQMAPAD
jgi:acyl-coenzyme A synthetase/AMP-(fatty) acid ligase